MSQAGHTPRGIVINNSATSIVNLGKRNKIMEILQDPSLSPYKE